MKPMAQQARAATLPGILASCSRHGLLTALLGVLLAGCAHHREAEKVEKVEKKTAEPIEYERLYHYPLQSVGTQFAALPPAVQRSIRAEVGSAQIADIRKGTTGSDLVYVVHFMKRDVMPPLYVAPDGSVLRPDLKV